MRLDHLRESAGPLDVLVRNAKRQLRHDDGTREVDDVVPNIRHCPQADRGVQFSKSDGVEGGQVLGGPVRVGEPFHGDVEAVEEDVPDLGHVGDGLVEVVQADADVIGINYCLFISEELLIV